MVTKETKNAKWIVGLVAAVIGAAGGSSGGTYVYLRLVGPEQIQSMARPDPFTGAQGQAIIARLSAVERRLAELPPRQLEQDVALLKREVQLLQRQIDQLQ